MIRVAILGYGNVGRHLASAIHKANDVALVQIYNRSEVTLSEQVNTVPFTYNLSTLLPADVYIIALHDDAISEFSKAVIVENALVVHTSGGVPISKLSTRNKRGVFYPLQTFTKGRMVDFSVIPICIEAESKDDLKLLQKLGRSISEKVVQIDSNERAKLHVAAVFVNNFVNHLYHNAEVILSESKLDFDLLKPLILETAHKIENLSTSEAQTGPAKRNDRKTIEKHLNLLKDNKNKAIYKLLTKSIQDTYGKEL
jgi:predicted short-subunit dehydrogenase-like oxidoreductase (DUF2520 family)